MLHSRIILLASTLLAYGLAISSLAGCGQALGKPKDTGKSAHSAKTKPPGGSIDDLGICIHFLAPKPEEVKLLKETGVRWMRRDLFWDQTEREPGKYDFSAYDTLLKRLKSADMQIVLILCYANPLYSEGDDKVGIATPEAREAYVRWAVAAMKHFRGRGIHWEVWNEPDLNIFWKPEPNVDNYVALVKALGTKIKQAGLEDEVLMGPTIAFCGNSTGQGFLETCLQQGCQKYWRKISCHYYTGTKPPEDVLTIMPKIREIVDKYAPGKPLIVTETGYTTSWLNGDEQKQGEYLPRCLLCHYLAGAQGAFVYDWKDDAEAGPDLERHFGLVRSDLEKKPAYKALAKLTGALAGMHFVKRLPIGGTDVFVLKFTNGKESKYAAWSTGKRSIVTIGGKKVALTSAVRYGDL